MAMAPEATTQGKGCFFPAKQVAFSTSREGGKVKKSHSSCPSSSINRDCTGSEPGNLSPF